MPAFSFSFFVLIFPNLFHACVYIHSRSYFQPSSITIPFSNSIELSFLYYFFFTFSLSVLTSSSFSLCLYSYTFLLPFLSLPRSFRLSFLLTSTDIHVLIFLYSLLRHRSSFSPSRYFCFHSRSFLFLLCFVIAILYSHFLFFFIYFHSVSVFTFLLRSFFISLSIFLYIFTSSPSLRPSSSFSLCLSCSFFLCLYLSPLFNRLTFSISIRFPH